ncbi:hypothetical protein BJY01DRAFT_226378 [Aspergillus pseudoustus]|uniref:BZIP domain-containing protein n=1 Tax=Aspergillus pseudoustus TaxID=1810923 RepID=A0ABR4IVS4_9EURO
MPVSRRSNAKSLSHDGPKPSWKAGLSENQLEKKRQKDRINQRRSREQSKQVANLFKDKMDLLMKGDHKSLIERMMLDNEAMSTKVTTLRSKLEQIYRVSKEGLDVAEEIHQRAPSRQWSSDSKDCNAENTANINGFSCQTGPQFVDCRRSFSRQPSIFFEIRKTMEIGTESGWTDMSAHQFIETVMAWKYSNGLTDGFEYLADFYHVPTSATDGALYSEITTSKFYATLLNHLHSHPRTVPSDQSMAQGMRGLTPRPPKKGNLSYLDITRRKTAYSAYQLVLPWRNTCNSHVEFIALFWAQYRHLLFFVFPSAENLAKCPRWYRPEAARLLRDQPGYIDFIIWPDLQDRLTNTWQEYDTEKLAWALIRGFHVHSLDTSYPNEPIIYLNANAELQLSESFERAIAETSNFQTQHHFLTQLSQHTGCPFTNSQAPQICCSNLDMATADYRSPSFPENLPDIELSDRRPVADVDTLLNSSPHGTSLPPSWLLSGYELEQGVGLFPTADNLSGI